MENVEIEPRKKGNKTVLILLLVLMVGLIGLALYNRDNLFRLRYMFVKNENINARTVFKRDIDSNQKANFITYEDKILWITKQGIKALGLDNQVEWEIKESFENPIVVAQEKYVVVADKDNLNLYQEGKKLWSQTTDGAISKIRLNKNGNTLLVVKKANTNGEVLGFNAKGQSIIKKDYIDSSYLVNADISSDSKKVAVLSICIDKSRILSKVDIFEIKSTLDVNSNFVYSEQKDDTLATDIKIFNNGNIVLVADGKIIILDDKGKNKNIKDFGESKVYRADISSGNYVVLEVNGTIKSNLLENKSREIQVYDSEGKMQGEGIKITSQVQDIDVFDGYFIADDGVNLYSISKGKLIWSYPLSNNIRYARGFKGKSQILLVYNKSIEIVEAN